MKAVDLLFTDEQHELLRAAATPEGMMVDEWVLEVSLAVAAITEDGRRLFLKRSPRRDPGARAPSMTPTMVRCPHCGIKTRRVATCDNCDEVLL